MAEVAVLYDSSKCTACKGCQVACKQWNQLSSPLKDEEYTFTGSYESPKDLGPNTFLTVRFNEVKTDDGGVQWNFSRGGCLHCTEASCEKACPVGAIKRTAAGQVTLDSDKCIGCRYCTNACPIGVPKWNEATNKSGKCPMCQSRTENGLKPACVSTCPTGALSFGDRDEVVSEAEARLREMKAGSFPDAELFGVDELGGTHVIYLAARGLEAHGLPRDVKVPTNVELWQLLKPVGALGAAAALGGLTLSFLTGIGYSRDEQGHDPSKDVE